HLLRGAAITVAGAWVVLALSAYLLNLLKYSDGAVLGVRIVALTAIVALIARFIARPFLPKLGDEKVALYLEEHERSLKAAVITAVEMQRGGAAAAATAPRSPAFIDRLTRAALERVHTAGDGRAVDAAELKLNGGVFAAVSAAVVLLTLLGPQVLRHG